MLRPDGSEGGTNSNPSNKEEGRYDEGGAFASLNPRQTANQQSPSAAAPGFSSKTSAIPASYRRSMAETDEDAEATGSKTKKRRTHSNVSTSSAARLDDISSGGNAESSGFLPGQRPGKFA